MDCRRPAGQLSNDAVPASPCPQTFNHPRRLADEARHAAAVGQQRGADAQRRGDAGHEAAEVARGQLPYLHLDRRPRLALSHAHQPPQRAKVERALLAKWSSRAFVPPWSLRRWKGRHRPTALGPDRARKPRTPRTLAILEGTAPRLSLSVPRFRPPWRLNTALVCPMSARPGHGDACGAREWCRFGVLRPFTGCLGHIPGLAFARLGGVLFPHSPSGAA